MTTFSSIINIIGRLYILYIKSHVFYSRNNANINVYKMYRTTHQFVNKYNYADYWCIWIVQYDKQWYLTLSLRKYSKITSQTFNFQTQKSFPY